MALAPARTGVAPEAEAALGVKILLLQDEAAGGESFVVVVVVVVVVVGLYGRRACFLARVLGVARGVATWVFGAGLVGSPRFALASI